MNATLFTQVLARELVDRNTPRFRRNEEWHAARLTADRIVKRWPTFVPLPDTQHEAEVVAQGISVRVEAETFKPEDIIAIMAPVRVTS